MSDFLDKDKQHGQQPQDDLPQSDTKKYFWVSVGAFVIGAVLFGLTFVPAVGQYGVISSMVCQLIAITFLNVQKKYNYFTLCKVLRVLSYAVLIAGALVLSGAAIFASQQPEGALSV